MVSKCNLSLMLAYVLYLLLGGMLFYKLEKNNELTLLAEKAKDRREIQSLLIDHLKPSHNHTVVEVLDKLSNYYEKLTNLKFETNEKEISFEWDYFQVALFAIGLVSTIGYNKLAPTTTTTRIFVLCYGTIGILIHLVLMAAVEEFFRKQFLGFFNRERRELTGTVCTVGRIILYLVPGLFLFTVLPTIVIAFYEGWEYDESAIYVFGILTTLGYEDYPPGTDTQEYGKVKHIFYQAFILLFILFGVQYIAMLNSLVRGRKIPIMEGQSSRTSDTTETTNGIESKSELDCSVEPLVNSKTINEPRYVDENETFLEIRIDNGDFEQ